MLNHLMSLKINNMINWQIYLREHLDMEKIYEIMKRIMKDSFASDNCC